MLDIAVAEGEHTDEVIRLAVLAGDAATVRDLTFTNCDIQGPAVVLIDGGKLDGCSFTGGDIDAVVWELPPDRQGIIGAVHVLNCKFFGCRFENIGVTGLPDALANFRKNTTIN